MTFLRPAAVCAILVPGITCADVDIDTSIDFTDLNRSAFVDAADELTQTMWVPTFDLFARLGPDFADAVPPYQRGDEFREIHGCIYDELSKQDALGDMNVVRDNSVQVVAYLEDHPELNVATLADDDVYLELAIPPDHYVAAAQTCGLFDINAEIIKASGVFELLTELSRREN